MATSPKLLIQTTFDVYRANGSGLGNTLGDWTVTSATVALFNTDSANFDVTPAGGNANAVHLRDGAAIEQTITTEVGRSYQVVFAGNGFYNSNSGNATVRIAADGDSVDIDFGERSPEYDTATNALYQSRSFTFTADSATTLLSFADVSAAAHTSGLTLADIQVIEIPAAVTTLLNNDPTLSYDAGTDKFYRFVDTPDNFNDALSAATGSQVGGVDGQLVTIRSQYENNLIRQFVLDSGNEIWLGVQDQNEDGNWNFPRWHR